MSHIVYILKCSDNTLYTGATSNLEKRINEHNRTKAGAKYTSGRRPVKLVYHEELSTLAAVRKREAEIKKLSRTQKNKLISSQHAQSSANSEN